jgi:hypothetical protein
MICSPLFIISNPDLVIAQCKAGLPKQVTVGRAAASPQVYSTVAFGASFPVRICGLSPCASSTADTVSKRSVSEFIIGTAPMMRHPLRTDDSFTTTSGQRFHGRMDVLISGATAAKESAASRRGIPQWQVCAEFFGLRHSRIF